MTEIFETGLSQRSERILNKIIDAMNANSTGGLLKEADLHSITSEITPLSILRANIIKLEEAGYITRKMDRDNSSSSFVSQPYWALAEKGESFWDRRHSSSTLVIPAADRFVSLSHNSAEVNQAKSALSNLADEIRKTNTELTADPADKIPISREIENLKLLLEESKIRIGVILTATQENSILLWLTLQTASGTIKALASEAIKFLVSLLPHK